MADFLKMGRTFSNFWEQANRQFVNNTAQRQEQRCLLGTRVKELMGAIQNFVSEMSHDRAEPTEEECDEAVSFLPPYKPENRGGARVTTSSSASLLSRYCSKLPGNWFTRPKPVYKIEEVGKDFYTCKLEMPINCQLPFTICSDPMPQKKNLTKMAAALGACKGLHLIHEPDDDLSPVRSLSDEKNELEEEEYNFRRNKKKKAGTKKQMSIYERKVPQVFIGSLVQAGQPQYLTVISIHITKLTSKQDLAISQQYFTNDACHLFGLLTNGPLPAVRSFKLYPDYGEVTVTLRCHKSSSYAKLTRQDLEIIQKFHCYLFSHVLRAPVELKPGGTDGSGDGYFVVLLKNAGRDVDYDHMRDALRLEASLTRLCDQSNKDGIIEADMVVSKNYVGPRQRQKRFAVLNVRHEITPLSPFPDKSKAKTYESYYGKSLTKMKQPLIEVKDIPGSINFLVDRKLGSKNKGDDIGLFAELCDVLPVRASLLGVSLMLPSILHRVNALLLVGDVKAMIAGSRDNTDESKLPSIGADDEKSLLRAAKSSFPAEMAVEYDDDDDFEEFPGLFADLKFLFRGSQGPVDHPNSTLVLQALTTTQSEDAFNLERLKIIGEAFLRLAVSIHLCCTHQDKDEGKLTEHKAKQISNVELFRAAADKSLAGYQQSRQLAHGAWCPTGCQFSGVLQERSAGSCDAAMECDDVTSCSVDMETEDDDAGVAEDQGLGDRRANTQMIADKSVADSTEALIGAYLISCGYLGALHFMKFLGLKVLPDNDDNDVDFSEFAKNNKKGCYARFWPDQANVSGGRNSEDMVSGLENFENNSIHYTFHSKLYLLEALTHASYHTNDVTPCYQRLEFLGDTLLDFLVTQHLYFHHAKLSLGELTDIRQALLNNNIFATIAVKYEFNKYLKQMSPRLLEAIENFITRVEDETEERKQSHSKRVTADPFIIVCKQDEEGIEAPKVLGDIFESVAGAVFLDSGMDLTKIWGVYYRMMKPYIDHYSVHIPINPIRRVHEEENNREFSKAEVLPDGNFACTLRVHWGEFVGKGKNKRIAKATAAKLAVQALEKRKMKRRGNRAGT